MSQPNSMPADWCAARVAEARRWVDTAPQGEARTHVIQLLSQLDNPPGGSPAPDWLPEARRRDAANVIPFSPAGHDARKLLKAYDDLATRYATLAQQHQEAVARAAELEKQLAFAQDAALVLEMPEGGNLRQAACDVVAKVCQERERSHELEEKLAAAEQQLAVVGADKIAVVQELLTEWRDSTTPKTGPGGWGLQQALLNHRAFFDMKCQQLVGRRLEPGGIYAGPPAAPPLEREAAAPVLSAGKLAAYGYEGDELPGGAPLEESSPAEPVLSAQKLAAFGYEGDEIAAGSPASEKGGQDE